MTRLSRHCVAAQARSPLHHSGLTGDGLNTDPTLQAEGILATTNHTMFCVFCFSAFLSQLPTNAISLPAFTMHESTFYYMLSLCLTQVVVSEFQCYHDIRKREEGVRFRKNTPSPTN
jgi:hypothetical protein